jgi:hypothetical protein
MFVEFLSHFASLDIAWLASLIFSNLHWLFAFFATTFFFYDGKKLLAPFLLIIFVVWASVDFSTITGWAWTVPTFLFIFYITRMAIMIFCSEVGSLKNYLPVIFVAQFLVVFAIFNLFFA